METLIEPKSRLSWTDFKEIWNYRELLYFLTWRDIKVRYKQTIAGIMWAIIQPFMTMVVFSIVFGHFGKIPSGNIPYPIFVYVGLLLWQFFSTSLTGASNSLLSNAGIVTKVYFPRLLLPISSTLTSFVDFAISSVVLTGIMAYFHYVPHLAGLLVWPLLLIISFAIAVGGGLIISSINVKYRDIRYIMPYFIQTLMFITPVIYPPNILNKYSWILTLNPLTGVMSVARSSILESGPTNWHSLIFSTISGIVLLIIGVFAFKKAEQSFADVV